MLPTELKVKVMKVLDIDSLPALVIASKQFYDTYKNAEALITYVITSKSVKQFLPQAMAAYAANHADWKGIWPQPSDAELITKVHEFGRKYLCHPPRPTPPILPLNFSFAMAKEMCSLHDTITRWAILFATESRRVTAWEELHETPATPTASELARICYGFYTIQITFDLFPYEFVGDSVGDQPWIMLWRYFAPWEQSFVWHLYVLIVWIFIDSKCHHQAQNSLNN